MISSNMNKLLLGISLVLSLFILSSLVSAIGFSTSVSPQIAVLNTPLNEMNVSSCGDLSIPNTLYILTQDLSSSETCFYVAAENVSLNGNGFTINGEGTKGEYGVYAADLSDVKISNLVISNFDYAIYFDDVKDSMISSITVSNTADTFSGIKIRASNDIELTGNTINKSKEGILVTTSQNSIISDNTFINVKSAIKFLTSSENNITSNIISSSIYGIYLSSSQQNSLISNVISSSNYGMYFENSRENRIDSSDISSSSRSDVFLTEGSDNNVFLSSQQENEDVEDASKLFRKWRFDALVSDSNGNPLKDAHISLWNTDDNLQFSLLTNTEGEIPIQEIISYIDNSRRVIDYNNFKIEVKKGGFSTYSSTFSINEDLNLLIVLDNSTSLPDPIIITNIFIMPSLPIVNNGSSQNISLDFDSNVFPLQLDFKLFKKTGSIDSIIDTSQSATLINKSSLPVIYQLPANLQNGSYSINLTFSDQLNNTKTLTLGFIEVETVFSNDSNGETPGQNNTEPPAPESSTSSGGGGGGGTSTFTLRDLNTSQRASSISNISISSSNNQSSSPVGNISTNNQTTGTAAPITGGFIGTLGDKKLPIILILIAIIIIIYLVIEARKSENMNEITEKTEAKTTTETKKTKDASSNNKKEVKETKVTKEEVTEE